MKGSDINKAGRPTDNTFSLIIIFMGLAALGLLLYFFKALPTATATALTPGLTPFASKPAVQRNEITDAAGVPMLLVPAGEFTMGSDNGNADEGPVRKIYLDSYYIDKYEVTNARYKACVDSGACLPPKISGSYTHSRYYDSPQYDDYPVIYVDWNMAMTYCKWRDANLPTEAQWEKAARGTDGRVYPWGNSAPNKELLNYNDVVGDTTEVGQYPKGVSPYGVMDMAGNVMEWVADQYDETYYSNSPASNPRGPESGQYRAMRGGSWYSFGDQNASSSIRYWFAPGFIDFFVGFRCSHPVPS